MDEERKKSLNIILEELTTNLDITETEDNYIRESYMAVGEWLSKEGSALNDFNVEIRPQGSYNLGTIIRPINEDDDLDIDLVCELKGKKAEWTQSDVKQVVGNRLKENDTYNNMLDEEGRRCWTLLYRKNSQKGHYHMDILPCVTNKDYGHIISEMYHDTITENYNWDKAAIRITDRNREDYKISTDSSKWLKSNPFGYARWFAERAKLSKGIERMINEGIKPLPEGNKEKLPLQKVVQILKRHRDIYYGGKDDKPISIIITTLAARAYNGEKDLYTALTNIVSNFRKAIREEYSPKHGRPIKVISNPVNPEENFADKWAEEPNKEELFYQWLRHLEEDILSIANQDKTQLMESFDKYFGRATSQKTFSNLAKRMLNERKNGRVGISTSGILSPSGAIAIKPNHNFFGRDEDNK